MNAYLGGLIARNLASPAMAIRPRLRSLFETPLVSGFGDSVEGAGLEENTVERFAISPPASPRQAPSTRPAPMAPEPAEASAQSVIPVARVEPPPEANPSSDAPLRRDPQTRQTDHAREPKTDLSTVRSSMPESAHPVDRGHPVTEQLGAQPGARFKPSTSPAQRLVVERETHTSERRTKIVDRSTVAPPATRPPVATSLAATRVAVPLIESAPAATPSITVTIGRVDVRAVVAPRPPVQIPKPAPGLAAQSLESYLRERSGGASR
jgi:hypothetical protein